MAQTIQDVFKQFCKERHAEDKGKNHDLLQEIYAGTEFFDMEFLDRSSYDFPDFEFTHSSKICKADFPIENFSLPFQSVFIHCGGDYYMFLREYAPNVITGTLYGLNYESAPKGKKLVVIGNLNVPFTIFLSDNYPMTSHPSVIIDYSWIKGEFESSEEELDSINSDVDTIVGTCLALNDLSHKAVAVDKPANNFYEYYRRKRKPTIKIPRRPIYYVLGEKNEDVSVKYRYIQPKGTLEYSYAFKVRGHWRRVGDKTLGKDRNGVYGIKGYTWVIEHIRGEGELSKRLHVVK